MRKTISARMMVRMTLAALLACVVPYGADVVAPFDSGRVPTSGTRPSLRAGRLVAVQALSAAGGVAPAAVRASAVSPADVVPALLAARARARAAGLTPEELLKLDSISILITDLPDATLGETRGSTIALDRTAAGWGWFVDPTPLDDAEFGEGKARGAAAGRIDLLTTIAHEMLHVLGRADLDAGLHPDDVMAGTLPCGVRRLTSTEGPGTAVVAPGFTLPAGRSVTITLDASIAKPFPVGVGQVSLQASITATGLPAVVSDDPSTAAPGDATVTPVSCPVVTVGPASIAGTTAGQPYSQTFTQSGGPGVITFSTTGSLPAGLTFNTSTGTLSGTPTQTGPFTFSVTATSENGCSVGTRSYTLQVACPVITVGPATLTPAIFQRPYAPVTFTATGGIGTTTFALTGALPPGLTFNASTATLSGTATEIGSFTITVTATDQNGCTGAQTYTLLVGGGRIITTGADVLVPPAVHRYTSGDGQPVPGPTASFLVPGFSQGVRVAEADMNGDGVPDILAASGHGIPFRVVIFDGVTGAALSTTTVDTPTDHGGLFVAAGDVDGDGQPDIITGAGDGPALVRVFSGASRAPIWTSLVFPGRYQGGVRVAAGDVNGDGFADIITAAAYGDPSTVKVFSGLTHEELREFSPYPDFLGGVWVAAGDVNGDGFADIVTGAGEGGGPHVRVFDGRTGAVLLEFFAEAPTFLGGVRVAAGDVNGDGRADIIVTPGPGGDGAVRVFNGTTGAPLVPPIASPVPASTGLFVSTAVPDNRMVIDAPAAGATVHPTFRLSGWAFQEGAPGVGVDAIHVWAFPVGLGLPRFLGVATLGDLRPDVGAIFGSRYTPSGYHLDVSGLADGRYDVVVFARNSASGIFNMRRLVRLRVRSPGLDVQLAVDTPQGGTVRPNFRVAGWSFDEGAYGPDSGVDAVHVWAQRAGDAPTWLGAATLGDLRPDVASAFGMSVGAASGYHLDVTGLATGDYTLMVFAKAAARAEFTVVKTVNVTVAAASPTLQMAVDQPLPGMQPGAGFTVAGWAVTADAPTAPGVDAVHVWAYPVGGGPASFVGAATLGGPRPDAGTIFGPGYEMSGFSLTVPSLPSGTWDIAVFARSTGAGSFGAVRIVRITVP